VTKRDNWSFHASHPPNVKMSYFSLCGNTSGCSAVCRCKYTIEKVSIKMTMSSHGNPRDVAHTLLLFFFNLCHSELVVAVRLFVLLLRNISLIPTHFDKGDTSSIFLKNHITFLTDLGFKMHLFFMWLRFFGGNTFWMIFFLIIFLIYSTSRFALFSICVAQIIVLVCVLVQKTVIRN